MKEEVLSISLKHGCVILAIILAIATLSFFMGKLSVNVDNRAPIIIEQKN